MPTVWINGAFVSEESAAVSVRDTGLLHAAGVFTTMRSYGGTVFRLSQHLARLRSSCGAMSIPLQYTDEQLTAALDELLTRDALDDARLRLTVTRGHTSAERPGEFTPTVFLTAAPLAAYPEEYYRKGMTAVVEDRQRLNPYDIQAGHKTLNYFSRLASLRSANERGAGEALWFNVHNYLQSGSISNVFVIKDGKLVSPPTADEMSEAVPYPKSAVLPGITRGAVVELAKELGIPFGVSAITIDALLAADEAFLTNSIMGVMPLCRIERKALGNDKPGPVTTQLMDAYAALVAKIA